MNSFFYDYAIHERYCSWCEVTFYDSIDFFTLALIYVLNGK